LIKKITQLMNGTKMLPTPNSYAGITMKCHKARAHLLDLRVICNVQAAARQQISFSSPVHQQCRSAVAFVQQLRYTVCTPLSG
jgi:hypothetical protein